MWVNIMSSPYIEEFLYRGRDAQNEEGEPTYHVVMAQFIDAPDGSKQIIRTNPMSPTKALEAGFSIESIIGQIAAEALRALDKVTAERNALAKKLADMSK